MVLSLPPYHLGYYLLLKSFKRLSTSTMNSLYSSYDMGSPAQGHFSGSTSPVYVILIIGMFLFMASNAMPALMPSPEKIG
jgi:hypothetical protein